MDLPATTADIIIAAGDIGVGTQGIRWLKDIGKPVLYVAGNHEYYSGDLYLTYAHMVACASTNGVHFLENDALVLGGVRFLGTTLWTDFEGSDLATMALAQRNMNDFSQIRNQASALLPQHLVEANWLARNWLKQELSQPFPGKTIVITHHAPLFASWNDNFAGSYRAAYCNDLAEFTARFKIDLWFHGHIHKACDYVENGVRVLCNPRGYNGHQVVTGFDPGKLIEI